MACSLLCDDELLLQERDHENKIQSAVLETRLQCEGEHASALAGAGMRVLVSVHVHVCQ